jgi:hypothetical protein
LLDALPLWALAVRVPRFFSGARLHTAGLKAFHDGDCARALGLFAAAAVRYRDEIRVRELAGLRVHELMCRVRMGASPEREPEMLVEIERLLSRLEWIQSHEPPFERVDARLLLGCWLGGAPPRVAPEDLEPRITSRAA